MMYIGIFLLAAFAEFLGFLAGYKFYDGKEMDRRRAALQELDEDLDRSMEQAGPESHPPEWFEGAVWMYERLYYDG